MVIVNSDSFFVKAICVFLHCVCVCVWGGGGGGVKVVHIMQFFYLLQQITRRSYIRNMYC